MAQLLSWGCCFPKSSLPSSDWQGMRSICTDSTINGIFWPGLCSCNFRKNPKIWKIEARFVPVNETPTSTWEVPPKDGWKKICSDLSQTETAFVEIYFGGLGWVRSNFFSPHFLNSLLVVESNKWLEFLFLQNWKIKFDFFNMKSTSSWNVIISRLI